MKKGLIVILVVTVIACQSNKEEVVNDTCSTAGVSYSNSIASIITSNGCLGCHSGAASVGGFSLQTYDEVKAKASQTRAGTSLLFGAVSHAAGFSPMPQGLPKLSSCNLSKLKAWMDAGMPQ